ncbi:MAG: hypothetical protein GY829_06700 [Gammaproteobacteria bacterium]|nr:hypothetical protein [Gammaproteobacteria bacterium]
MVLIALAVIFFPLILDGQKKNQTLDSKIPEKPNSGEIILVNVKNKTNEQKPESKPVQTVKVELDPVQQNKVDKTELAEYQKSEVKKETVSVPVVKSEPVKREPLKAKDKKNVTSDKRQDRPNYKSSAFVIQLGSFRKKTNAQKLVDKLKKAGYKAYLKAGKSSEKSIYRVLVGPDLKRPQAESKIKALNKISGLKAIILSYDPLRH